MKTLLVIAPKNFRDEELFDSKRVLEARGIECVIASTRVGEALGMLGGKAVSTLALNKVDSKEFNAIVFVGGIGVEENALHENRDVLGLAKKFAAEGKVVAAICIAPRILAAAGLLKGKRATAFSDGKTLEMLKRGGAIFTRASVEADGKIITADGPRSARAFGEKIASSIAGALDA